MKASRKLNKITALLKKKKAIDLLENLDMLQDFLMTSGVGLRGNGDDKDQSVNETKPEWTDSKYNWRVETMEHAGRAPPTVDSKDLRKIWDPEEDATIFDMRKEEKGYSKSLVAKSKRRSRQNSASSGDSQQAVSSSKNRLGLFMGEAKTAAGEYTAAAQRD